MELRLHMLLSPLVDRTAQAAWLCGCITLSSCAARLLPQAAVLSAAQARNLLDPVLLADPLHAVTGGQLNSGIRGSGSC